MMEVETNPFLGKGQSTSLAFHALDCTMFQSLGKRSCFLFHTLSLAQKHAQLPGKQTDSSPLEDEPRGAAHT